MSQLSTLLILFFLIKTLTSLCQEAHITVCEDLFDIKNKTNDTTGWRHLQIGSAKSKQGPPLHIFNSNIIFKLLRTEFLTIIKQLRFIQAPLLLTEHSRLRYLNLYENDLIEINDLTFSTLPKIQEIYLRKNKIQHLGRELFKGRVLEIVDLSRNKIRSITTCFLGSNIKWIVLNNNEIDFINPEAFPNSLEQLELNDNRLETLHKRTFKNLINLRELFMERNRLTSIPRLEFMKSISYLHFAYNKIEEVHYPFNNHKSLSYLDLSSNKISNVTVDGFTASSTPPMVLLNFNRLTNIVFQHPEKSTDLILYGNPWNCDCLFKIEKILKENRHMKTCEVNFFDKGQIPFCIEHGKCGTRAITKSDIDQFLEIVKIREQEIKDLCFFRL